MENSQDIEPVVSKQKQISTSELAEFRKDANKSDSAFASISSCTSSVFLEISQKSPSTTTEFSEKFYLFDGRSSIRWSWCRFCFFGL
jgi:hypothetical protein